MKAKEYGKYLSRISYGMGDISAMEIFHEQTKFNPYSINNGMPRLIAYMTEHRAMLETANNKKLYRYSPKITPAEFPVGKSKEMSLKACLDERQSAEIFTGQPTPMETLFSILYDTVAPKRAMSLSIEGDHKIMKRPYASGGALYPVEVYPIILSESLVGDCEVTHYCPIKHELSVIQTLSKAALLKPFNDIKSRLEHASVLFVFTSVVERSAVKYGNRSYRFSLIEAGEVAQNISLSAVDHGMSTLPWGGYYDDYVAELLNLDGVNETVLHVLSMGYPTTMEQADG